MSPTYALFRKEFHQHGTLAAAVIGLCLFSQGFLYFFNLANDSATYFANALIFALLYIGVAAAAVYSAEHDHNTFDFLRKLPISPLTIAKGKTAWILCSSLAVLLGNLLVAFLWTCSLSVSTFPVNLISIDGGSAIEFYFLFIEVFLWGLFWTTRCRRQISAVVATFFCPMAVFYLVFFGCTMTDTVDYAIHYRLMIAAVVALFTVWGMLRWFEFDKKRSRLIQGFTSHLVLFRYPKRIQSPFFALFHQHIRQASILYPLGIACFVYFSCIAIGSCYYLYSKDALPHWGTDWLEFSMLACMFGIILFWGTIFGADQKNHSYRFLMRLGIHEGTIWWSRMLIPFLSYIPVLVCWLLYYHLEGVFRQDAGDNMNFASTIIAVLSCTWLAPVALGAFFSISFHRQILAAICAGGGTYILILLALYGVMHGGISPWWTMLPICLAFLLASRLQAKYWLRDINTFRSRLIPLLPVIGTVLAVLLIVFAF